MALEGGMKCVKFLLVFFNFIFWVSRKFNYFCKQPTDVIPRSEMADKGNGKQWQGDLSNS